ncbi:hypothetical protein NDK47_04705 [Brevibacillus ruminantium]|uniref:Uncharacterized protein n=1 Tax=Brevibacillus ruminantium TaxID=2950604 RepID=A0ABY4WHH6_9BACL|nr:hypothetical protein [Brevibacillus ruminantium]USG66605.1 hypothetical protein NDK47_04705 [Brevibacillus ruminantium]
MQQSLVFPIYHAPGTVYYVALDGDDSNPGTLDSPWRTIQKAAVPLRELDLQSGDTITLGVLKDDNSETQLPSSFFGAYRRSDAAG